MIPFGGTALVVAGLSLAPPFHGPLRAQTYVQIAELNPNNPIGPRITSTVTQAKLSGRTLFGWIGDKITYIWAPDNQSWTAYEFASDEAWNRVLFGHKDVYIHGVSQVDSATSFLGPAGLDHSAELVQSLRLFVADRANGRVVRAKFEYWTKSLTAEAYTHADPDLNGVTDVAFRGLGPVNGEYPGWQFYAVSVTGRVSFWTMGGDYPSGNKRWAYGDAGSSTGQFRAPKGICVGHAAGTNGGSTLTADIYVADGGTRRLVWLRWGSTAPTWMGAVTLPNSGVPLSCTVDHFGNVTVADSLNSRLVKYTWNLTYLDSYGSYGVGASNHNTLAHPLSVDVPCGMKGGTTAWVWFCDGRVITAEDWGTQSGAREHYLGIKSTITAQPYYVSSTGHWDFTYSVTDHANHQGVTVINADGNVVRSGLAPVGLKPPGSYTADWNGYNDAGYLQPNGVYRFRVRTISAYGCGGSSWCDQTLTSGSFTWIQPLAVSISGPDAITVKGTYTWEAMPSGGTGGYAYQWVLRYIASGQQLTLGTAKTQSKVVDSNDNEFELKVTVTSGSASATATKLVTECIGGGSCFPNEPTP